MSNNAFSFADELRVNSKLRARFAQAYVDTFDEYMADEIDSAIQEYGAEDYVVELMAAAPTRMAKEFGVR